MNGNIRLPRLEIRINNESGNGVVWNLDAQEEYPLQSRRSVISFLAVPASLSNKLKLKTGDAASGIFLEESDGLANQVWLTPSSCVSLKDFKGCAVLVDNSTLLIDPIMVGQGGQRSLAA